MYGDIGILLYGTTGPIATPGAVSLNSVRSSKSELRISEKLLQIEVEIKVQVVDNVDHLPGVRLTMQRQMWGEDNP